ncbi:MAG TPA: hypothetical protein PLE19_00385 [Planctomycetota bacterium]|nr:hypothetical protein [Planctomycetota bacterium]HRR79280.1 hypothetical protein [Planctomycetota bacterium]HRT97016.1 hypothetical protein [Planctomycetota bacterium]
MSDEQERAAGPAAEETPGQSPDAEASQPQPEESGAPTPGDASAPPEGEGAVATSLPEGAGEPDSEEEGPPPEPEPAARPAAPPEMNYDGLESGLAWFGAESFEPPAPVGYAPVAEQAAAPPRELSEQELDQRRRRIHGRFETRRKEVETQKPWYRKIPMGALSMLPILVVLAVVAILYPPWGGGSTFPASKQPLDEALLTAQPVADPAEALRKLGVQEAMPHTWEVLPGDILRMAATETAAKLVFAIPKGLGKFEIACDLCFVERDSASWGAALTLDQAVGITLQAHPSKPGRDYVAGRRSGLTLAGHEHVIQPRTWNEVKIVLDEATARYFFNGKALNAAPARPSGLTKVELTTYNTRLMVRNWRIKPIE